MILDTNKHFEKIQHNQEFKHFL